VSGDGLQFRCHLIFELRFWSINELIIDPSPCDNEVGWQFH
jgi:hypothetical protein